MIIETTIWKKEPYTETVRQIADGSLRIKEVTKVLTIVKEEKEEQIEEQVTSSRKPRKPSGLVVDVFGMTWKEKVKKIKAVLEENNVSSSEIPFSKSVVRKENKSCPDNFMVSVKLDNGITIYEASGKFSVKRLMENL